MAEIKHILRDGSKKVEVFVTPEELLRALQHQDPEAFNGVILNLPEYCLTFKEV